MNQSKLISGIALVPLTHSPRNGFYNCLLKVLRLQEGALMIGGPPCGSFVWVNRATSKRSRTRLFGDMTREYVKAANAILVLIKLLSTRFDVVTTLALTLALSSYLTIIIDRGCFAQWEMTEIRITCRFVLLCLIAIARGAQVIWEQPSSSLMLDFPYLKFMAVVIDPVRWGKVRLFQA